MVKVIVQRNTKTQRHKDLTKTGRKPFFCKAPVRGTAVSKAIPLHPTSKLVSADELLLTALSGLSLQKRENGENQI